MSASAAGPAPIADAPSESINLYRGERATLKPRPPKAKPAAKPKREVNLPKGPDALDVVRKQIAGLKYNMIDVELTATKILENVNLEYKVLKDLSHAVLPWLATSRKRTITLRSRTRRAACATTSGRPTLSLKALRCPIPPPGKTRSITPRSCSCSASSDSTPLEISRCLKPRSRMC
eukprot:TRINITY_DN1541_c0_g1_i2.p1 TRINITY_DN1541_c0_g1~~TRINITY_DN1541_c0_g1_i2.p1  ORF type:complete len:177 (+),score=13.61 TRINITY_DN1541_c0_g1_i2:959-1489(+)